MVPHYFFFFMARRRTRRKSFRVRRYRRKSYRRSLRRKVASINRRLAAEVKKNDNAKFIIGSDMQQLTNLGVHDFAYCYPVLDATMKQGT